MTLSRAYIGLGSNLGDRESHLSTAVDAIKKIGKAVEVSSYYETAPQGFRDQPAFVNAVCRVWTWLDPFSLLHELKRIEAASSRHRTFVNAPRTLDLDILIYGGLVLDSPGLVVPHPRMAERSFVLAPLSEIAPDAIHPVLKAHARTLLARLPPRESVFRLNPERGDRATSPDASLHSGGSMFGIASSIGKECRFGSHVSVPSTISSPSSFVTASSRFPLQAGQTR